MLGFKAVISFFSTFKFFIETMAFWIPNRVHMMTSNMYSIFNTEDNVNRYGS